MIAILSKSELRKCAQEAIVKFNKIKQGSSVSDSMIYQIAIDKLKVIDETVFKNVSKEERMQISRSCSGFNTKELSIVNSEAGALLSKVNYNYALTFDLVDPDILSLL